MPMPPQERWSVAKPTVMSEAGIVVARNARAGSVGAEVAAAGGNAVATAPAERA